MIGLTLKEVGIEGKVFCVSMQRSGTSSVGDFLEQFGLIRIGSPASNKKRWPNYWLAGDYNSIFSDDDFKSADVFEDDPWWFPEFYKYIYRNDVFFHFDNKSLINMQDATLSIMFWKVFLQKVYIY